MDQMTLGRTGITVNRNGFGALPIQRIAKEEAARILRRAYEGGIRWFDTARAYSDSEEKIGYAFAGLPRDSYYLSTKAARFTVEQFWADLHTSLEKLGTDYVDLYQFHNPPFCPKPGDGTGLYEAMQQAKAQGKIRFIGFTNHRLPVATEAVESGLYDVLQFPFSYLASEKDEALVRLCAEKNVGFLCMKALSGGLITRSDAAYAYLAQFPNTLPIWGVQRESELEEFLAYQEAPPRMDEALRALIAHDRQELSGAFCRGCGYCMPCPQGIEINNCARMSLLLRRSPAAQWLTEEWQARMQKIETCLHCGKCKAHCPYGLDTPALLERNYEDYKSFLPV